MMSEIFPTSSPSEVMTLSPSSGCCHYVRARAFASSAADNLRAAAAHCSLGVTVRYGHDVLLVKGQTFNPATLMP
jgi:hypothetical protein